VTSASPPSVLIIGGEAAGLASASHLSRQGCRVTWIDPDSRWTDCFTSSSYPALSVLGCHRATQTFLESLVGSTPSTPLSEASLQFLLSSGRLAHYPRSRFPNPLHQMLTIGRFAGLAWSIRWKLLSWLEQIWEGALELSTDLEHRTALNWIASLGHGEEAVSTVWAPLAHWLTGNDLQTLSADAFVAVLKPFFLAHSTDSRVFMLSPSSQAHLKERAAKALVDSGTTLLTGVTPVRIDYQDDRLTGVRLSDGSTLQADWYVSALSAKQLTPLLPERWLSRYAYFQQITELSTRIWTIFQLRITQPSTQFRLILGGTGPIPILTLSPDEFSQGTTVTFAVPGPHDPPDIVEPLALLLRKTHLSADRLLPQALSSVRHQGPLALTPGAKARRPLQRSPIANFLLAGGWTDTGWPDNLESAIVSAERCARIVAGTPGST